MSKLKEAAESTADATRWHAAGEARTRPEHDNLMTTSDNLSEVATPVFIGVLTTFFAKKSQYEL